MPAFNCISKHLSSHRLLHNVSNSPRVFEGYIKTRVKLHSEAKVYMPGEHLTSLPFLPLMYFVKLDGRKCKGCSAYTGE